MSAKYNFLKYLYHGTVRRLSLLVWPDPDGLMETDVQLYLEVECTDGIHRKLTFSTSPDAETPCVEYEVWDEGIPFSQLTKRVSEWKSMGIGVRDIDMRYEIFDTAQESSLRVSVGAQVTGIYIVKLKNDEHDAAGLILEFDSGKRIVSAPSAYGNAVRTSVSEFSWPCEIEIELLTPYWGSSLDRIG